MFFSVIIPTRNRQPILAKCLRALERQVYRPASGIQGFEIVLVDDGSTDGTADWVETNRTDLPHVRLLRQPRRGAAQARNLGLTAARGDQIVFIDSDLVVTDGFLAAHAAALGEDRRRHGNAAGFSSGRVVDTSNFADPTAEPCTLRDYSRAFFATGNVAIARTWLDRAGGFDPRFDRYGWEDLELGVRLRGLGVRLVRCPAAIGYHWHPRFVTADLPHLLARERERAAMGALFYRLHPTPAVRMMIQCTPLHRALWGLLSLGGWLDERRARALMERLTARGRADLALLIARILLNREAVRLIHQALAGPHR